MFSDKEVRQAVDKVTSLGVDDKPIEKYIPILLKVATAYLEGKLQPKWDKGELIKLIEETGTWHMGEWSADPDKIADALVGKVGKQYRTA
jgi:hypothetical protein